MKVKIINSTVDGNGDSIPLPEAEWYYEGHPTVKLSDNNTYEYHPTGISGPQLLGNKLNHERQVESDEVWLAECSPPAKQAKADAEHNAAIDKAVSDACMGCLVDLLDYITTLPDCPQKLKDVKTYIDGEKVKKK